MSDVETEIVSVGEPSNETPENAVDMAIAKVVSAFAGTISAMSEESSIPSGVFRDLAFLVCAGSLISGGKVEGWKNLVEMAGTMAAQMTTVKEGMDKIDAEKRRAQ